MALWLMWPVAECGRMHSIREDYAERVDGVGRGGDYPCADYPAIGEILDWAKDPETGAVTASCGPPSFAPWRRTGICAWWKKTAHVGDLYEQVRSRLRMTPDPYLEALGRSLCDAFKAIGL